MPRVRALKYFEILKKKHKRRSEIHSKYTLPDKPDYLILSLLLPRLLVFQVQPDNTIQYTVTRGYSQRTCEAYLNESRNVTAELDLPHAES